MSGIKRFLKERLFNGAPYRWYVKNNPRLRALIGKESWFPVQTHVACVPCGSGTWAYRIAPSRVSQTDPIIYAVGLGDDITFELDAAKRFGTMVYAIDPTPRVLKQYAALKETMPVYPYALSDKDGTAEFYMPENPEHVSGALSKEFNWHALSDDYITVQTRKLSSVMRELGHTRIDILKINAEGAEHAIIHDILLDGVDIGQFAIAVRGHYLKDGPKKDRNMMRELNAHGYRVADYSPESLHVLFVKDMG